LNYWSIPGGGVSWDSSTAGAYSLQRTSSLASDTQWRDLIPEIPRVDGMLLVTTNMDNVTLFYRVIGE